MTEREFMRALERLLAPPAKVYKAVTVRKAPRARYVTVREHRRRLPAKRT